MKSAAAITARTIRTIRSARLAKWLQNVTNPCQLIALAQSGATSTREQAGSGAVGEGKAEAGPGVPSASARAITSGAKGDQRQVCEAMVCISCAKNPPAAKVTFAAGGDFSTQLAGRPGGRRSRRGCHARLGSVRPTTLSL